MHGIQYSERIFGSHFEAFQLDCYVPVTKSWMPEASSTNPFDHHLCQFEIRHHKFKMAEDSRDAAPTSRMFLYRFFTNICGKK